jgi:hypothetical protein
VLEELECRAALIELERAWHATLWVSTTAGAAVMSRRVSASEEVDKQDQPVDQQELDSVVEVVLDGLPARRRLEGAGLEGRVRPVADHRGHEGSNGPVHSYTRPWFRSVLSQSKYHWTNLRAARVTTNQYSIGERYQEAGIAAAGPGAGPRCEGTLGSSSTGYIFADDSTQHAAGRMPARRTTSETTEAG